MEEILIITKNIIMTNMTNMAKDNKVIRNIQNDDNNDNNNDTIPKESFKDCIWDRFGGNKMTKLPILPTFVKGSQFLITMKPVYIELPHWADPKVHSCPWKLRTWIPFHVHSTNSASSEKEYTLFYEDEYNNVHTDLKNIKNIKNINEEEIIRILKSFSNTFPFLESEKEIFQSQFFISVVGLEEEFYESSKEFYENSKEFYEDIARLKVMNASFSLSPEIALSKLRTALFSSTIFSKCWQLWLRLFQLTWYYHEAPFSPNRQSSTTTPFPSHSWWYFQKACGLYFSSASLSSKNSLYVDEWCLWYERFVHLYYMQLSQDSSGDEECMEFSCSTFLPPTNSNVAKLTQWSETSAVQLLHHIQQDSNLFFSIPFSIRHSIFTNSWFYLPSLATSPNFERFYSLHTYLPPRPLAHPISTISENLKNSILLNPSMASNPCKKILVNARYSNYDIHTYRSLETHGHVNTWNLLFFIDESFEIQRDVNDITPTNSEGCYWLTPSYPVDARATVWGLEDVKLFWFKKRWWFTANCCDYLEHYKKPCVVLGELEESPVGKEWRTRRVDKLSLPKHETACEKNWITLVMNDELYIIYSLSPFVVYQCFFDEGESSFIKTKCIFEKDWSSQSPLFHTTFRGSGPFLLLSSNEDEDEEGNINQTLEYIGMCHEVIWTNKRRKYVHRWIRLCFTNFENSQADNIKDIKDINMKVSDMFTLDDRRTAIQYSLGLCPTGVPGQYFLSRSVMDDNGGFMLLKDMESMNFETMYTAFSHSFRTKSKELTLKSSHENENDYSFHMNHEEWEIWCTTYFKTNTIQDGVPWLLNLYPSYQSPNSKELKNIEKGRMITIYPQSRLINIINITTPLSLSTHGEIELELHPHYEQTFYKTISKGPLSLHKIQKIRIVDISSREKYPVYLVSPSQPHNFIHPLCLSSWERTQKLEGLPLIFWIHREKDIERGRKFREMLYNYNIGDKGYCIPAVDASEVPLDLGWPLNRYPRKISSIEKKNNATKALVCSHVRAIQTFFEDFPNEQHALIMEDDATFDLLGMWPFPTFQHFVNKIVPEEYLVCHLSKLLPLKEIETSLETFGIEPVRSYATTLGYLISRKGAKRILEWFFSYPCPALSVSDVDIFKDPFHDLDASEYTKNVVMTSWPLFTFDVDEEPESLLHPDQLSYQKKCQQDMIQKIKLLKK